MPQIPVMPQKQLKLAPKLPLHILAPPNLPESRPLHGWVLRPVSEHPEAATWKGRDRGQWVLLWMGCLGQARGGTHELRPGGRDAGRGKSTQTDPTSRDPNARKRNSLQWCG